MSLFFFFTNKTRRVLVTPSSNPRAHCALDHAWLEFVAEKKKQKCVSAAVLPGVRCVLTSPACDSTADPPTWDKQSRQSELVPQVDTPESQPNRRPRRSFYNLFTGRKTHKTTGIPPIISCDLDHIYDLFLEATARYSTIKSQERQ